MSGKVIVRVGGSLRDALYFMCDGKSPGDPKLTGVQSAAFRFDDHDAARAKIQAIASGGHAWADRMGPVQLVGVKQIRRSAPESKS